MDAQAQSDLNAVLVGVNELSLELIKVFKSGGSVISDGLALFEDIKGNADLQAKLLASYSAVKSLSADVKLLDSSGVLALGMVQLGYVEKIVAAL